jgi:DNA replication protein DnaC
MITYKDIANPAHNNKIIVTKPDLPKVREGLFQLPTCAAFVGAKGSGKSHALVNLMKEYYKDGVITNTYIISPTYYSPTNAELQTLPVKKEDIYVEEAATKCIDYLKLIIGKIGKEVEDWKKEVEYKKIYDRYVLKKQTLRDNLVLENNDFRKPDKKKMLKPVAVVIIDDLMKSPIYDDNKNNPFGNLVILHRHLHKVGFSIFMLVQTFKNSIPKFIRAQCNEFFIFKTSDMKNLESMYEEFGNVTTYETFVEIFYEVTKVDHNFLTVSPFHHDPNKRFRKNFDQYIEVPQEWNDVSLKIRNKRKRLFESGEKLGNLKKQETVKYEGK